MTDKTVFGWSERSLQVFAGYLTGERPLIRIELSGFQQLFTISGDAYSSSVIQNRADHKEHLRSSLIGDVPPDEDALRLVRYENKLVGSLSELAVRVEGSFSVTEDAEWLKSGHVGSITLTGDGAPPEDPYLPLLEFSISLQSRHEARILQHTLQSTLGGQGRAHLNLVLDKVAAPEKWIEELRFGGYTSALPIRSASVTTDVGSD